MPRYFLEVSYRGDGLSGFQIQDNAPTIQSAIESAFLVYFRREISLTGSSRTDAGVHARQNFFHFDWEGEWDQARIYNLNALLPDNIAIRSVRAVHTNAHARFDALSRAYEYVVYRSKDPFLKDYGWHFPYELDKGLLDTLAAHIRLQTNFESFSKRNTQVLHYACQIKESYWSREGDVWTYHVEGNRFLRGMVRALVSTMLQVSRGNKSEAYFYGLFGQDQGSQADFSAPPQGLFLKKVVYPGHIFIDQAIVKDA
jgi:tRNA pseudouridine38-40 synthase